MDFTKYGDRCWFIQLKESRAEFTNVENIIESAKFKYDRDMKIPQWVLGVGISFLLLAKEIIDGLQSYFKDIALIFYLITTIVIIYGVWKIIELSKIQGVCMMYLYREMDKQNKKERKSIK